MTPRKSVVAADRHPVMLAGIRALIEEAGDFELIGQATDGTDALALILRLRPHLAVVDLALPGTSGLAVVREVARRCPSVMTVVLTAHDEAAYVQQALKSGARGYLLKRSDAQELVRSLRSVSASGVYIDPAIAAKMLGSGARPALGAADLSEREAEVLKLAARGFSNKEMAAHLDLSVKTIETYKARATEKLNLRTRAEIVRYASAKGWMGEL